MLKPNFEIIPQDLKKYPYWNCFNLQPKSDGKVGKPPVGLGGQHAKVDHLHHWTDFESAKNFYEKYKKKILPGLEGEIAGLGILLQENKKLVAIDVDHCLNADGSLSPIAAEIVETFTPLTYVEKSVSGTGLHIFLYGEKTTRRCKDTKNGIELYSHGRYMTVSGCRLENSQNYIGKGEKVQAALNALIVKLFPSVKAEKKEISTREEAEIPHSGEAQLTDNEVIDMARKFSKGFPALFDYGDISKYNNDDSAAELALCNMLAWWTRKDAAQIDRLMRQSALLKSQERITKWDRKTGDTTYGARTIARAIQDCKKEYEPRSKKKQTKKVTSIPDTGKPKIIHWPGELPRLVKELENSIRGKAWQRDAMLVQIINLPEKKSYHGLRMAKGTSIISPFEVSDLMLLANKCADWIRIKTTKDEIEEIAIDPPQTVLKAFLAAKGYWTLPPLSGLVTCPIIRPDGSILDKPGYDEITGLYADFEAKDFPLVDVHPAKKSAENSLATLEDTLSEFPFKTDVDRAVALAAMLTTILRPSVRSAPLFAFSAPCPGTGKSALADMIGIIATGKPCAAMDFNRDESEFKKAVFASLIEGSPVTLIDNVMGEFNSTLLNIILSQETIKGRVLGFSKTISLPTNSLWLATGNNLTICGDLTRRTFLCTLDANTEKPAERKFSRDIYQWTNEYRGKLIHAALTILRAYHLAGKPIPDGMKPMNGFNDWSHWIRGALLWLGADDPKDSQLEIEAHDPEYENLQNVFHAWYDHFGSNFVTTKNLLDRDPPVGEHEISDTQLALYQTLLDVIPHGKELTGRILGKWLARYDGRVIDGLKLINTGQTVQHLAYWKVVKI